MFKRGWIDGHGILDLWDLVYIDLSNAVTSGLQPYTYQGRPLNPEFRRTRGSQIFVGVDNAIGEPVENCFYRLDEVLQRFLFQDLSPVNLEELLEYLDRNSPYRQEIEDYLEQTEDGPGEEHPDRLENSNKSSFMEVVENLYHEILRYNKPLMDTTVEDLRQTALKFTNGRQTFGLEPNT